MFSLKKVTGVFGGHAASGASAGSSRFLRSGRRGELTIESLPNDLLVRIFSFLPDTTIFLCGAVNKRWHYVAYDEKVWELLLKRKSKEVLGLIELTETDTKRSFRRIYHEAFSSFNIIPIQVNMKNVARPARKLSFQLVIIGGPASGKKQFKAQLMGSKKALPASGNILIGDHALYIKTQLFKTAVPAVIAVSNDDRQSSVPIEQSLPPPQPDIPEADMYCVLFDLLNPGSLEVAKDVLVALNLWKPSGFPHIFLIGSRSDLKAAHLPLALTQQRTAIEYARRFNVSRYCEICTTNEYHVETVAYEAAMILASAWGTVEAAPDVCSPSAKYVYCSLQ